MQQVDHGFAEQGIVPEKLGHLGLSVHDPERAADFYQRVLGFRVSDRVEDYFVFLRCGPDHHTLNLMRSRDQKLNISPSNSMTGLICWWHVSCWEGATSRYSRGPGRHGAGHNIFTYHRDPNQHVIELFTDLDLMLNEELGFSEPRPWHEDRPQNANGGLMAKKRRLSGERAYPPIFLGDIMGCHHACFDEVLNTTTTRRCN